MLVYVMHRLLSMLLVGLGVVVVSFAILHLVPGDPVQAMLGAEEGEDVYQQKLREYGLDQPLHVQFLRYLEHVVRGDLGQSIRLQQPVNQLLWPRYAFTMQLALVAIAIAALGGVLLGTLAAMKRGGWLDSTLMVLALAGVSTPVYVSGIVLMFVFAGWIQWDGRGLFPAGGVAQTVVIGGQAVSISPYPWFMYLVLPALTLGLASMAVVARMARATLLEVLTHDYVRTAKAMGFGPFAVHHRFALRNAMIPIVTVIGLEFGYLLGGAVLTETVFALPGLGTLVVDALRTQDYPLFQSSILVVALTFGAVNLLTDLCYGWIDPRIRHA